MAAGAIVTLLCVIGVSLSIQPTYSGYWKNKEITPTKSRLLVEMAKFGGQLDKICNEIKCKSMGTPVKHFLGLIIWSWKPLP